MTTLRIEELASDIPRLEALLDLGEEIQITREDSVIGRIMPERPFARQRNEQTEYPPLPDFMARLKEIYGDRVQEVSGAEIIQMDRDRF